MRAEPAIISTNTAKSYRTALPHLLWRFERLASRVDLRPHQVQDLARTRGRIARYRLALVRYDLAMAAMRAEDAAIELSIDRTILKCAKLPPDKLQAEVNSAALSLDETLAECSAEDELRLSVIIYAGAAAGIYPESRQPCSTSV